MLRRLRNALAWRSAWLRAEATLWTRWLIAGVPGETGIALRRRWHRWPSGVRVLEGVTIYHPETLTIGRGTAIAAGCVFNAAGGLRIGEDVLIGPGVKIWTTNHNYRDPSRPINQQGFLRSFVIIQRDVWISAGCVVLPGVILGEGAVIAAGAVVTRAVPAYHVVAGVPARTIGTRRKSHESARCES